MKNCLVVLSLFLLPMQPVVAEFSATVLWYLEHEPGVEPYEVRYIASENFLRSDDGRDDSDFLLFNRRTRQIYNVVSEDKSILQLDGVGVLPSQPESLSIQISQSIDKKMPKIADNQLLSVSLNAADTECATAVVVPNYLSDARKILQEFSIAVAVSQARTLSNTPNEYQTACFLAKYIYSADFQLEKGIVLNERDAQGRVRELSRFEQNTMLKDELLQLPKGFQVYQMTGDKEQ